MTQINANGKKGKKKKLSANLCKSVESADQIVVEIKGLDVYDPTTGQIRGYSRIAALRHR